jgi:predicted aspartyl protease
MAGLPLASLLALIAAATAAPLGNRDADRAPAVASADALFKQGKFADAGRLYAASVREDAADYHSTVRLGYVALLSNRLDEAQTWLKKAIELKPSETPAKQLLAEIFYRRDDFQRAAPLLRDLGRDAMAKKLADFHGVTPYLVEGGPEESAVKFVLTDPLPVLSVKVNGSQKVNFFIDTGAAEVVLDTAFAKQVGAKLYGDETGRFAGGRKASYQHGRIDSLTLGDITVRNVPVQIMDTRRFSAIFGGKRVDGIIGTVLLRHFISTLDYPGGRLVLRRNTKEHQEQLEREAHADTIVEPFWMAGDHFIVAWGTIAQSKPVLFFVDTGLAGGGVTCSESLLKEAGIDLAEDQAAEGLGGGGKVKVVPFLATELALGAAKEQNVRGLFTGPFPLEYAHGFRIGGIISHGFFRPYALTFDFAGMRLILKRES